MMNRWVAAIAVAMLTSGTCAAAAGQRAVLSLSGSQAASSLTVKGTGQGSRLEQGELRVSLNLKAELQPDASQYRIVGSSVFLKAEGAAAEEAQTSTQLGLGTRVVSGEEDAILSVDPLGPLAQSAKAACSAQKAGSSRTRETSMLVPVVWRVTTGRFDFAALAAAGLQPAEAMLSDVAYYTDRATDEAEASVNVTVICKDMEVAALPREEQPKPKASAPPAKDKPQRSEEASEIPAAERMPPASPRDQAQTANAFKCDGGIVRETLAGAGYEVCLCPGNTARRQTGERAYACEKRYAARR